MFFSIRYLARMSTRKGYLDKLKTSIDFWKNKGGVLSDELIDTLRARGIKIEVQGHSNYKTKKKTSKDGLSR